MYDENKEGTHKTSQKRKELIKMFGGIIRAIVALSLIIVLVVGIASLCKDAFAPTFKEDEFKIEEYRVEENDGLYTIYYKFCKDDSVDIYEYTEKIKELNGMKDSTLYKNEKIKVYVSQ